MLGDLIRKEVEGLYLKSALDWIGLDCLMTRFGFASYNGRRFIGSAGK